MREISRQKRTLTSCYGVSGPRRIPRLLAALYPGVLPVLTIAEAVFMALALFLKL
ncbi:hypothetical protein [Streptomyces sp. NPDC096324]|uniref:hypothetical protein n=1 Tax=Streptomyces sp. NPDC096324 TaxID=3366085 RepID=UPI0037FE0813